MAGRPKKINTEEKIDVEENSTIKEIKQETPISNDMFSQENMVKMFAMFKQFQNMENEQKIEKHEVIKEEKQSISGKFTKSMLIKLSDEVVVVRSAVDNVNFLSPKTKIRYKWAKKGAVEPLPISEILAMENYSTRYLHTPWLIIEDERVVQALELGRTYDLVKKVEDISELVKLSKEEITKIFNELPKQYQNNFRNEIYRKVKTRELNNLTTIDNLSEILHINLKDIEIDEQKEN